MGPWPPRTAAPAATLAACELNSTRRTQRPESMLVRPCVFAEVGFFISAAILSNGGWDCLYISNLGQARLEKSLPVSLQGWLGKGRRDSKVGAESATFWFVCLIKLCAHVWGVCVHAYVYVCLHSCRNLWMNICICTNVCKPQADVECLPQLLSTLYIEASSRSWTPNLLVVPV